MRFSAATFLTLPLLAAASQQQTPLEQAKEQAQYWFDKVLSFIPEIPNPSKAHTDDFFHGAAAKVGGKALHVLTLNNWEETLRGSVKPASSTPEEWWVLVTGGNKTCFGQCTSVETAYNESAVLFAANPTAPHLAYLNCDNQPVLCNSWGAGPPHLWILEMTPAPAPVDIHLVSLNITTTTVKTFTDLHALQTWKETEPYTGYYFHPFHGKLAEFGVAVPLGYVAWAFGLFPSWLFMIGISFLSRTLMSKRTGGPQGGRPASAAAAAPPAGARVRVGAPPGDGRIY